MDFTELVRQRYSVRGFRSDPVPDEQLRQILEAARMAPTACNEQPFSIIIVHTEGWELELRQVYERAWFWQAPLILVVCTIPEKSWSNREGKRYADVDAAIVMDHIILQATDLGLGTCWIAAFDPQAARRVFKLPEGVDPLVMTPLGYAAVQPQGKERKPLELLVHYECW